VQRAVTMSGAYEQNQEIRRTDPADAPIDDSEQRLRGQSDGSFQSYRIKCGYEPISLSRIEFRILKFLSSKPYHAFTPRRIAEAVSTEELLVTEESLPGYIASLRRKLGFFSDYVQTVPYIGYRFKE
jgi:DNA-binding response OmpR family regulator